MESAALERAAGADAVTWRDHLKFTREELARAAGIRVWCVRERDTFGFADDRDPPRIAFLDLDRASAEAWLREQVARQTPFLDHELFEAGLDQVMRHAAAASERRLIRGVLDRLPPTGSGAAGGA